MTSDRTFARRPRRTLLALGWAMTLGMTTLTSTAALAEDAWPSKPITYVVPYPPGGTTDIIGRALAQHLGTALHTTIVVDNRAGATGTIGGAWVARAEPDGYTLLGTSIGPQTIAAHLMKSLPYDPLKAYEPVALVGTVPHILVVKPDAKFKTVKELVDAARSAPGAISYASGGNGTILRMQGELLQRQTGTQLTHVPYKGDTPAMQDVIGGQVNFMFAPVSAALPQVQAGTLRALAVTSAAPLSVLPGVPTMAEAGFKDFVVEQWQAVYAPAKTPAPVVAKLNKLVNEALKQPEIAASLTKLGVTAAGGEPDALKRRQEADSARWGKVISDAHITLE